MAVELLQALEVGLLRGWGLPVCQLQLQSTSSESLPASVFGSARLPLLSFTDLRVFGVSCALSRFHRNLWLAEVSGPSLAVFDQWGICFSVTDSILPLRITAPFSFSKRIIAFHL